MNIFIASDHAGVEIKKDLIETFSAEHNVTNIGTDTFDSVDYPDYAHLLCSSMNEEDVGILICGTGIGMSIVANRYDHIRCAVVLNEGMASVAREHNNANVIALGARMLDSGDAANLVDIFLRTKFEGGRHQRRVEKINIKEHELDSDRYRW